MSENDDISGLYLACIKETINYCMDDEIDHIKSVQKTISKIIDDLDAKETIYDVSMKDINVYFPREFSLLHRLTSSLTIHCSIIAHGRNRSAKSHLYEELAEELTLVWGLCKELTRGSNS